MSKVNITDFFLKLGFDAKDVEKGLAKVDKDLQKLSKHFVSTAKKRVAGEKGITTEKKKQESLAKRELSLANAKLAGAKKMAKLKSSGADMSFLKEEKNALRSKNLPRIQKANQFLDQTLFAREQIVEKGRAKAEAAQAKVVKANKNIAAQEKIDAKVKSDSAKALAKQKDNDIKDNKKSLDTQRKSSIATHKKALSKFKTDTIADNKTIAKAEGSNLKSLQAQKKSNIKAIEKADKFSGQQRNAAGRVNRTRNQFKMTQSSLDPRLAGQGAAIQKEMSKIRKGVGAAKSKKELDSLAESLRNVNDRARTLTRTNAKLNRTLSKGAFAAKAMKDSLNNMARSHISAFALMAGGAATVRVGQDLVSVRASMLAASGGAEQAAIDFQFVKEESFRLGVGLSESARGYAKIGAAARSSGMDIESSRNMFLAATEVSAAFNLTGAESEGVFRAFSQILGKGRLSAEEMNQLGERIPTVWGPAAEAMGKTVPELRKLMELGKLDSVSFLPNFSDKLRELVQETGQLDAALKTSRSAMNRFGNSFQLNILKSFDAGLEGGLNSFFNSLTKMNVNFEPMAKSLGKIVGTLVEIAGVVLLAVQQVFRPFMIVLDQLIGTSDEAAERVGLLGRAFALLGGILLVPFALLEQISNRLDSFFSSDSFSLMGEGVDLITAAIMALTLAWSLSPMGRLAKLARLAVVGVGAAYTYLSGDDTEEDANKAASNAAAANAVSSGKSFTRAGDTKNTQISIQATDPEAVGRIVKGVLDEETDAMFSVSMEAY
jgi:tape measure domain-containing protein